ncbi:hypothetical protein SAMN04489868_10348 [Pisciglobus halotolerans]|uniref:Heavy-metal-associated domain-containing protein n=1 Tax=Pisciglobus halotolerans TaxID=745365 RepID=A0A1I3B1X5_9LACT|nr:hypothetical protein SAMN04489868_10348 [Pisciglobus halotolerans]
MTTTTYVVPDMSCGHCKAKIEKSSQQRSRDRISKCSG